MRRFGELFLQNLTEAAVQGGTFVVFVCLCALLVLIPYEATKHLSMWLAGVIIAVEIVGVKTVADWNLERRKEARKRKEYVESVGGYPEL